MNHNKIKTINIMTGNLTTVIQSLQSINNALDEITTVKAISETDYKEKLITEEKNRELIHSIWKIKILWYIGQLKPSLCQQIINDINSIKNCFDKDKDYSQIVNFDTINEFRFVNFNTNDPQQQVEINCEPIENYLNNTVVQTLNYALNRLDNFIKNDIDNYAEMLNVDDPNPDIPAQNVTALETIWDFNLKIFTESIQSITVIQQEKCQKIINKLTEYKLNIENANEFLLSKTYRWITINHLENHENLITNQVHHIDSFIKKRKNNWTRNQVRPIEHSKNDKNPQISNMTFWTQKFIDNQLCVSARNNEVIQELRDNFEKNTLAECKDETTNAVLSDMKQKLLWVDQFVLSYNHLVTDKLINSSNIKELYEMVHFNQSDESSYLSVWYLETKRLLENLKIISHKLLPSNLADYKTYQEQVFTSLTEPPKIFENDIDVDILPPHDSIVQNNVKKIAMPHNDTSLTTSLALSWRQIQDAQLFQILNETEELWINQNIFNVISIAQKYLIDNESTFFTTNSSVSITKAKLWTANITENLKTNILTANDLLVTAANRWFESRSTMPNSSLMTTTTNQAIKSILLQQSASTIFHQYLDDYQLLFSKDDKNNKNQLIIKEKNDFNNFKEALWLIKFQQQNLKVFLIKIINCQKIQIIPELLNNNHLGEITVWTKNQGIVNFCDNSPQIASKLATKPLVAFKSKKTQILIDQWKDIYLHNLNYFYGDNESIFIAMTINTENIRKAIINSRQFDNSLLPTYVKNKIENNLGELITHIEKLKHNQNQYLLDHSTNLKQWYQNCYSEQNDFRVAIYNDFNFYVIEANVLKPVGSSMLENEINNFYRLINNLPSHKFNGVFGSNWSEQLNQLYNRISFQLTEIMTAYNHVFKNQPKVPLDEKQSNNDKKIINLLKIDKSVWEPTKFTNNFCEIPNDKIRSFTLTPEQINDVCCQNACSTDFDNQSDTILKTDDIMLQDWIQLDQVSEKTSENHYQIKNLWQTNQEMFISWQENNNLSNIDYHHTNNNNLKGNSANIASNYALLFSITLIGGLIIGTICLCYYCVKKWKNCKPIINIKESQTLIKEQESKMESVLKAKSTTITMETSFL